VDKRFKTEVNLLKTRYGMPGLVTYLGHVTSTKVNDDGEQVTEHFIALELMECDLKHLISSWNGRRGHPGHLLACQVSCVRAGLES
jgi:hypothetical protein